MGGQARTIANPMAFMLPNCVRMFTYSCDETFHASRQVMQQELESLLDPVLQDADQRNTCVRHIFGGTLPAKRWFELVGEASCTQQAKVTEAQTPQSNHVSSPT